MRATLLELAVYAFDLRDHEDPDRPTREAELAAIETLRSQS